MDILFFLIKIVVILLMCHVLFRMLAYFRYQVTYYYHSRHIEKFLEKEKRSAEEYLNKTRFLWHHNFARAPHLRGGGTRAFVWKLLCKAREDIAIRIYESNKELSLYCFSCYFSATCPIKYHLSCHLCQVDICGRKRDGHDRICKHFMCNNRIEND